MSNFKNIQKNTIKINTFLPVSEANGPGKRFVVWTQGCNKNCPGCFNPGLKDTDGGFFINIDQLITKIQSVRGIEGISISGGEPFLQLFELSLLFRKIKKETDLSILVFSGFSIKELENIKDIQSCFKYIDVLLSGPYIESEKCSDLISSSSNQTIHFLSDRYNPADFADFADFASEIIIHPDGHILLTGCDPLRNTT